MLWSSTPFSASSRIDRRLFLQTGSLAAAALWATRAEGVVLQSPKLGDSPFKLGVASGDPTADGFVIWTRLAPKPLEGGGMPMEAVEVAWEVADDEQFSKVVKQGKTTATPDWAHSVHVEVEGLPSDRWYFYRFHAAGEASPVGRARTFPAADAKTDRLRFAFASCQHFEAGLYTAYEHMLRDDLDVVAHLGDYIYEGKAAEGKVRKHNSNEIDSLLDYRNRHALYKSDSLLQAAHQRFPWIVTWDDHEVDNNYAGSVSEQPAVNAETLLARRARAYQAYYEHMPLRRAAIPHGPDMRLHRQVSFGPLANFYVLDTRQFRTNQPNGDGLKDPGAEALDPKATLLGEEQERWLMDGLGSSKARWNILAQQVMMARVDLKPGDPVACSMDQWPGYEMNRRRILQAFHERHVSNPVVLTGDIHSNWANNLVIDYEGGEPRVVGSEFVGTSISSGGDGTSKRDVTQLMSDNPFVKFFNAERGYVRCDVSSKQWKTDYQTVEFVTRPGAPVTTRAAFVIEDGVPGMHPA